MAIRKARKRHICDLCKREIQKGERYSRIYDDSDGMITDQKECINCEDHAVNLTAQEKENIS